MRYLLRATPLLLCVCLCAPFSAVASAGASLSSQSLFLSHSVVTAGASVEAYVSVSNDSAESFGGTVSFSSDSTRIGAQDVELSSHESGVVSFSWKPLPGTHLIEATLQDKGGNTLATAEATLDVVPSPASAAAQPGGQDQDKSETQPRAAAADTSQSNVESSDKIEQYIAGFSPQTALFLSPTLSKIDSMRQGASNALKAPAAYAQASIPNSSTGLAAFILGVFWICCYYFLVLVRNVISIVFLFYPVFILIIFYILYVLLGFLFGLVFHRRSRY